MSCKMCESLKDIKNDPHFIMELETGYVVLGWYQRFKGYTFFDCIKHAAELHQLDRDFRMKYMWEMSVVAEAVSNAINPDKLNLELLGNGASHLHWHIIPRTKGDTPEVGPIWKLPYSELFDDSNRPDDADREELKATIKKEILNLINT